MAQPCKFCGKPLEHELACPYLESYEEPPTDGTAETYGCLSVAKFKQPVHKIVNGKIISLCKGE